MTSFQAQQKSLLLGRKIKIPLPSTKAHPGSCWRWCQRMEAGGERRGPASSGSREIPRALHPARREAASGAPPAQGAASTGACGHPGVLPGRWGAGSSGFSLKQQGLAAVLSLVFVTRLNFHPRLFSCSGVAVLAFLLRNVDLFGWMLDGQMESYASECSEPTFRNTARSGCHS